MSKCTYRLCRILALIRHLSKSFPCLLTHAYPIAGILFHAIGLAALGNSADQPALTLYVATYGNDSWTGRFEQPTTDKSDGPFATLHRARNEIRKQRQAGGAPKGGVTVLVRGGTYFLENPVELSSEDSGTKDSPIVYAASPGEEVRISGGRLLNNLKPVTDPAVRTQLDDAARDHILKADLKSLGIDKYGSPEGGGPEVFQKDKPLRAARWPNEGFVKIVDLVEQDGHEIHGIPGSKVGKFYFEGDRPIRWIGEKDAWLHGYWFWDWSDQRQPIESIDLENKTISLKPPYHPYGYRKGQWYYAFNMLSELDSPGEYFINRETGDLYVWLPSGDSKGVTVVSNLESLFVLRDASHIQLKGFTMEAARGTAATITGGSRNAIHGCVMRNLGGNGAEISGEGHGILSCEIYATGRGGISINGGDRKTLQPGGLFAENNHIHHYGRVFRMYQPGIAIQGVGNRVSNNLIHTAPHIGIIFSGNDHLIEYNEIYDVCYESNDAGAIYAGRNWTMRGNVIRHNYLHDISGYQNKGCVGVYLDDMFASAEIFGNIFYKVTAAAFIGGGRDCSVVNNVFVDCDPALHVDARALGWAGYHADEWIKEAQEKGTLSGIAYREEPYASKYTKLPLILDDEPKAPKGNVITRNICVGGKWERIEEAARPYLSMRGNLLDEDPHFVDAARLDFKLKEDSPAFAIGFEPIPVDKIGLQKISAP